jgi:hypothetical protein
MQCARAYAATADFMDEEPFCLYQPNTNSLRAGRPGSVGNRRDERFLRERRNARSYELS